MVFKPNPVQGSGFGFWPGHQVGQVNLYFKKIQNGVVLVKIKTKVNGLQPGFAGSTGSAETTPNHDFFYFSSTRLNFNPESIRLQINSSEGTKFQNYLIFLVVFQIFSLFYLKVKKRQDYKHYLKLGASR